MTKEQFDKLYLDFVARQELTERKEPEGVSLFKVISASHPTVANDLLPWSLTCDALRKCWGLYWDAMAANDLGKAQIIKETILCITHAMRDYGKIG